MKLKQNILLLAWFLVAYTAQAIVIDTVYVGDADNANDTIGDGYGGVSYDYYIGTYEVTNAQYTAFLNSVAATDPHGLYNVNMPGISRSGSSGSYTYTATNANTPVTYVSFWDAARFTNWLTSGNTETGVYLLGGVTNPTNYTITRNATAWANGGVAIANENEWYKAAYYDPTQNEGSGSYWLYPTQSNTAPTGTVPNSNNANSANYNNGVGEVTDVGSYVLASSYYGTFDQGGNVFEWNDEILSSGRGIRGGSFYGHVNFLWSLSRNDLNPTIEEFLLGFRVSSLAPIPEPSTAALLFGGVAALLIAQRRRRK